jgi:nicotinamidase-related amidase
MPVAAIDPQAALVVIDLQQGLRDHPLLTPFADIVARAGALAAAFRAHGLPVVLVNTDARAPGRTDQPRRALALPPGWTDVVPELDPRDGDLRLTKHAPGAFGDSPLAATLRARGVTQVLVIGVSTSNGVEATARGAFDLGFNVAIAIDAVTDGDAASHEHSLARVFPRIAETGAAADVLALLAQRGS